MDISLTLQCRCLRQQTAIITPGADVGTCPVVLFSRCFESASTSPVDPKPPLRGIWRDDDEVTLSAFCGVFTLHSEGDVSLNIRCLLIKFIGHRVCWKCFRVKKKKRKEEESICELRQCNVCSCTALLLRFRSSCLKQILDWFQGLNDSTSNFKHVTSQGRCSVSIIIDHFINLIVTYQALDSHRARAKGS